MTNQLQDIARFLISKDIDIFEPDILTAIKKLAENEPIILKDASRFIRERDAARASLNELRADTSLLWERYRKLAAYVGTFRRALRAIAKGKGKFSTVAKKALKKDRDGYR